MSTMSTSPAPQSAPPAHPTRTERAVVFAAAVFARLPVSWRWQMARCLAALSLQQRDSTFLEMLQTNLTLCCPDWTADERQRFIKINAAETFFAALECFHVWHMSEKTLRAKVTLANPEVLHAHVGAGPLVLLCPHFLGMEFCVQRMALEGPAMSIYRISSNPRIHAMRLKARNRFCPQYLVPVGDSLLPVIRKLRAGLPLFLLPDLDMGLEGSTFAPFFGVPAATPRTTAWCVTKARATLLPVSTRRVALDRYVITFGQPVKALSPDIDQGTAEVNALIEAMVRDMPEQYLWAQPRFKTRPSGEPAVYSQAVLDKAAE